MTKTDGLEAQTRLREFSPETNVIIMTGCEPGAIHAMALEAGAFGFVAKPFTAQVFLSLIHQGSKRRLGRSNRWFNFVKTPNYRFTCLPASTSDHSLFPNRCSSERTASVQTRKSTALLEAGRPRSF
jgi:DNA-binding response OmpR family regulator